MVSASLASETDGGASPASDDVRCRCTAQGTAQRPAEGRAASAGGARGRVEAVGPACYNGPRVTTMTARQAMGKRGEELACRALARRGYRIVARNWRCHGVGLRGEIDIVARDGECWAFVEVKTRRWRGMEPAVEALTDRQMARLTQLAQQYLADHNQRWGNFAAAAVLSGLPITVAFLICQRWIIGGLTAGGVKG